MKKDKKTAPKPKVRSKKNQSSSENKKKGPAKSVKTSASRKIKDKQTAEKTLKANKSRDKWKQFLNQDELFQGAYLNESEPPVAETSSQTEIPFTGEKSDSTKKSENNREETEKSLVKVNPTKNHQSDLEVEYKEEQDVQMSFVEHLDELRKRFINILIIFGVLALIAISFSEYLVKFLQEPYIANGKKLITTRPTGAFMTRFRIALMSALILALPFTLHQLWLFVFPALTGKLKKMGLPLLIFSTLLFWGGIIFNYLFVLPMVMKAFQDMIWPGVEIAYNIDDYYDFISMTSIVFGVIFEMPVVVLLFVRMGFLTHRFLLKQWRYSLVIGAVIAAILTPPDAFSQTMMLIPMILLYLISILIAYIFRKRDID